VDYRQIPEFQALGIEILHHSELLARLALPLQPSAQTVTYHDPCYLARGRGVTDQPRAVLRAAGASVKEMQHYGKRTFCCGAGGAQLFIAEDAPGHSERVNHRRFAEVLATGATTVAVACPYCPIMLKDAATHARRDDVLVLDIAEILAGRLAQL
jgi:Fe-S oxidoreductase